IKYQNIHTQQTAPEPPTSNNPSTPTQTNTPPINSLIYNVITSVIAIGVVGIITWFVKTKIAKKIAKEYTFTMEKYIKNGIEHINDKIPKNLFGHFHLWVYYFTFGRTM